LAIFQFHQSGSKSWNPVVASNRYPSGSAIYSGKPGKWSPGSTIIPGANSRTNPPSNNDASDVLEKKVDKTGYFTCMLSWAPGFADFLGCLLSVYLSFVSLCFIPRLLMGWPENPGVEGDMDFIHPGDSLYDWARPSLVYPSTNPSLGDHICQWPHSGIACLAVSDIVFLHISPRIR
jgi:hypothetical protein